MRITRSRALVPCAVLALGLAALLVSCASEGNGRPDSGSESFARGGQGGGPGGSGGPEGPGGGGGPGGSGGPGGASASGPSGAKRQGSGGGGSDSQMPVRAQGVAVDSSGNIYIADSSNNRVRKVDPWGTVTVAAGNGKRGFSGDGGPATAAQLATPCGVAADPSGAVYIADSSNNRVRRIDAAGIITTVAGTGKKGFAGDGGPAVSAQLSSPTGLAFGADGCLYIFDAGNDRVRKIGLDGGISTIAVGTRDAPLAGAAGGGSEGPQGR